MLTMIGCPAVITLDYVPSNSLKGQGTVQVETFRYEYRGPKPGPARFRSGEIESGTEDVERLYLSQDIGQFFAKALRSELSHSGYQVVDSHELKISGVVDRFAFDWSQVEDETFEIQVTYRVMRDQISLYDHTCRSEKRKSVTFWAGGVLMKAGVKDCIEQFIRGAQNAKILEASSRVSWFPPESLTITARQRNISR
jgi:hypothetical protein